MNIFTNAINYTVRARKWAKQEIEMKQKLETKTETGHWKLNTEMELQPLS